MVNLFERLLMLLRAAAVDFVRGYAFAGCGYLSWSSHRPAPDRTSCGHVLPDLSTVCRELLSRGAAGGGNVPLQRYVERQCACSRYAPRTRGLPRPDRRAVIAFRPVWSAVSPGGSVRVHGIEKRELHESSRPIPCAEDMAALSTGPEPQPRLFLILQPGKIIHPFYPSLFDRAADVSITAVLSGRYG